MVLQWLWEHWFDLVQVVGVVGGLVFTAWTILKDERARQISNLIAINARHNDIWSKVFERPVLSRVLKREVDFRKEPISEEEFLFVKMLFLHLDTVRRAAKAGLFIQLRRMKNDVRNFMKLPIPKAVWEQLKPFQDDDFITFIDECTSAH